MATIFSNASGQVVQARDALGIYYYLADGLGTPTVGGWSGEEDAIAALEGDGPAPDLQIDEQGRRLVECADCYCDVPTGDRVPKLSDDEGWKEQADWHADDCQWIETRAYQKDV